MKTITFNEALKIGREVYKELQFKNHSRNFSRGKTVDEILKPTANTRISTVKSVLSELSVIK